jgi:hypothetical protein
MYIYFSLLRMTGTVTSQNIDLSSWDILCRRGILIVQIANFFEVRNLLLFTGQHDVSRSGGL